MEKHLLTARPVLPYKKWSTPALRWRLLALRADYSARRTALEEVTQVYRLALSHFQAVAEELDQVSLILDSRGKSSHVMQGRLRHCHFSGREEWAKQASAQQLEKDKSSRGKKSQAKDRKSPEAQVQALLKDLSPQELLAMAQALTAQKGA